MSDNAGAWNHAVSEPEPVRQSWHPMMLLKRMNGQTLYAVARFGIGHNTYSCRS